MEMRFGNPFVLALTSSQNALSGFIHHSCIRMAKLAFIYHDNSDLYNKSSFLPIPNGTFRSTWQNESLKLNSSNMWPQRTDENVNSSCCCKLE